MSENKKIKVLVLADHPLSPSGVGSQTKYVIEALLKTEKFSFVCFGGAIKHERYDPIKVDPWGEDWVIFPTDGYGNQDLLRSAIRSHKPDMLWFMTDPRFFGWLWDMEDEIRPLMPMVYYHVWDNKPYPMFNKAFYESTDYIAAISKVTDDIVKNVAPDVPSKYIPHAVDSNIFMKLPDDHIEMFKKEHFGEAYEKVAGKFMFFWNNRNARRKQSGSLIFWFKDLLDRIGHDKAMLLMHTDVHDVHGQDLVAIINNLGLTNGEVMFSRDKVSPQILSHMYNMADCTVNVADAEGFGLATLESLSCETPIVVTMTGGLQEQVTDGEEWFGIGLEPASKAIIGSQEVPYIYEDRVNGKEVTDALEKMYNMTKEDRKALGVKGREHVMKNYNFESFEKTWQDYMLSINEKHGSWETRKGYKSWELIEV